MDEKRWYYLSDGNEVGPINTEQLKERVQDGRIDPEDRIHLEGMEMWMRAVECRGLFPKNVAEMYGVTFEPKPPPPEAKSEEEPAEEPEEDAKQPPSPFKGIKMEASAPPPVPAAGGFGGIQVEPTEGAPAPPPVPDAPVAPKAPAADEKAGPFPAININIAPPETDDEKGEEKPGAFPSINVNAEVKEGEASGTMDKVNSHGDGVPAPPPGVPAFPESGGVGPLIAQPASEEPHKDKEKSKLKSYRSKLPFFGGGDGKAGQKSPPAVFSVTGTPSEPAEPPKLTAAEAAATVLGGVRVMKKGEVLGPFSPAEVQQKIRSGEFDASVLICMESWVPLSSLAMQTGFAFVPKYTPVEACPEDSDEDMLVLGDEEAEIETKSDGSPETESAEKDTTKTEEEE